jgi:hypothetical protein
LWRAKWAGVHLQESETEDWREEEDSFLDENEDDLAADLESASSSSESFEQHVLYRAAFTLTIWIDQLFESAPAFAE